jgi:hypothetical protein
LAWSDFGLFIRPPSTLEWLRNCRAKERGTKLQRANIRLATLNTMRKSSVRLLMGPALAFFVSQQRISLLTLLSN